MGTDDLDRVYGAKSAQESRAAYDGWADSYDADNLAKGFVLPSIAAGFVARHVPKEAGPILDAGCGTGLVGAALAVLGYRRIAGIDLSPRMLEAAGRLGVYDGLAERRLGVPLPEASDTYAAVTCVGAFGPGHAPPESLDEFARVTRPSGHVVFNIVEASYVAQGFPETMARLSQAGIWREIERSGPFRAFLLAEPTIIVRVFVFEVL
ncbi:MAG: class I SAM-dependent DNA methyltransferase [Pikeienuella sp.]